MGLDFEAARRLSEQFRLSALADGTLTEARGLVAPGMHQLLDQALKESQRAASVAKRRRPHSLIRGGTFLEISRAELDMAFVLYRPTKQEFCGVIYVGQVAPDDKLPLVTANLNAMAMYTKLRAPGVDIDQLTLGIHFVLGRPDLITT